MLMILLQNETGLGIGLFFFFIAMYREGLPNTILLVGFSVIALTLMTLLIPKNILFIILSLFALVALWLMRRDIKRNKQILFFIASLWAVGVFFSQVAVPFAFTKVLKVYQVQRIYTMLGQELPDEYVREGMDKTKQNASEYNVSQSKIAIASGGFLGKGFLNGTQTQYNWVPEQRTDFIFCSVGEQFGFWGATLLLLLYMTLLLRIIHLAERQRSPFSRIYMYCIAGILFFHLFINVGMTIGMRPSLVFPCH
jgi:Bacterial cell division membrane protein